MTRPSHLDLTIIRAERRRDLINAAHSKLGGESGVLCDLGLGNGRAFDHIREVFAGWDIYGFDKKLKAHPTSVPDDGYFVAGDVFETLAKWIADGHHAVLIHVDLSVRDETAKIAFCKRLEPLLIDALADDGAVISDLPLSSECWILDQDADAASSGAGIDTLHLFWRRA